MIQRVDVLTGGASSVYGADAVSGVVNFIMDTNFTGVRLDAQYSFYPARQRRPQPVIAALDAPNRNFGYPTGSVADGGTCDSSLAIGAAFDDGRGHVIGLCRLPPARTRSPRAGATTALRADLAHRAQMPQAPAPAPIRLTDFTCGGSATSANGTFFTNVADLPGRPEPDLHPRLDAVQFRADQLLPAARTSATRSARSPITRSARRCSRTSK